MADASVMPSSLAWFAMSPLVTSDEPGWAWRRDADATPEKLAESLARLGAGLTAHLAIEEEKVLPLAEKYLTAQEWHRLGDHAINGLPKTKLPIVFGMLAQLAEPDVVTLMLSTAPNLPARPGHALLRISQRVTRSSLEARSRARMTARRGVTVRWIGHPLFADLEVAS